MGPKRQLKFALEAHWAGRLGADELHETARELRSDGWRRAQTGGINLIPSGSSSEFLG